MRTRAGRGLGQAQPPDDFGRDGRWRRVHVNDDWMLVGRRFLQDRKLAVEQGHGHEMLMPRRQAAVDQVI